MDKPTGGGVVLRSLNVDFDGGRSDGGMGESVEATKEWAARHALKRMPLEHNSQHALVTCREQITNLNCVPAPPTGPAQQGEERAPGDVAETERIAPSVAGVVPSPTSQSNSDLPRYGKINLPIWLFRPFQLRVRLCSDCRVMVRFLPIASLDAV